MNYVIGLTGSFGSGCNFLATEFIQPLGYKYFSLSKILKQKYFQEKNKEANRPDLQDYGNELREKHGKGYLAELFLTEYRKENPDKCIVDSIRNPGEIEILSQNFPGFHLIGVFADKDLRWKRLRNEPYYNNNLGLFEKDDERDMGEDFNYGQRVTDCFLNADIILSNNKNFDSGSEAYENMQTRISKYFELIEHRKNRLPNEKEALMAIAYANGLRSSCLKRKVGAIIIDSNGQVFSSGFNEVPILEKSCKSEHGGCYRGKLREKFAIKTREYIDSNNAETFINWWKDEFKILDYCRALHAEESAILSVARNGSSALKGATLYTSTYPCNLCANKIAQVGVKEVIYLEPYPMGEAKMILTNAGIKQTPFEGVTYNGYFKLFKEEL
jgi:deoxycytidylate deaminase